MEDRAYLSIGEVLSLLKAEFPDVTISKIRFLESQGLLDPERTPSGYRKFYANDVDRLRWILRQQREHFLPLKVIKGRLRAGPDGADELDGAVAAVTTPGAAAPNQTAQTQPAPDQSATAALAARRATLSTGASGLPTAPGASSNTRPSGLAPSAVPASAPVAPNPPRASAFGSAQAPQGRQQPAPRATGAASTEPGSNVPPSRFSLSRGSARPAPEAHRSGVSLTLAELVGASGLPEDDVRELERFGLIAGRRVGPSVYYDEDALTVAHLAAGFMKYGVEARHLRMYKTAGEREAGFFEQVVMPMLKQRNPDARRQAVDVLEELTRLGQDLRSAMLSQALRPHVEGS